MGPNAARQVAVAAGPSKTDWGSKGPRSTDCAGGQLPARPTRCEAVDTAGSDADSTAQLLHNG